MEFEITRTSTWGETKPCEEAYRKKIIRIDERGFRNPEEYKERLHEDWFAEGFNHRIVDPHGYYETEHIYREFDDEIWAIKINSLEELLELKEKYGDLVIENCFKNKSINSIEIYDYYRE